MRKLTIEGAERDEVVGALSASPWFCALRRRATAGAEGERQLERFIAATELVEYEPGEVVVKQGGATEAFHVVVGGTARVEAEAASGPRELGSLQRPASFGEVSLLLDEPCTATVVAQDRLLALRVDKAGFRRLVLEIPEFGLDTSQSLARRLRDLTAAVAHTAL